METRMQHLFKLSALLLAFVVLGGMALPGSDARLAAAPRAAPGAAPAAQIASGPMPALQEASCTVADTTRTCEIWALPGSLTMPDGASLPVWGFGTSAAGPALVPGPVISATVGETLQVVLHNEIAGETVSLAFPGQEGIVPDLVGVGAADSVTYTLTGLITGTYLYEAGLTPGGARQVSMGMAGPLIVNDAAPTWDQEVVLVLNEFDPAFNDDPANASTNAFRPRYWLINGLAFPDTGWIGVEPGSTVRLRYLNAGVQHHTLGLLGLQQTMIAADAEALPFPRGAIAPVVDPGQTLETEVTIPGEAVGGTLYPLYNASLHQHNNNQRTADMHVAFGGMLTFLRVAGEPPVGPSGLRTYLPIVRKYQPSVVTDEVGPIIGGMSLVPDPANGDLPVTLHATADDRTTGGSTVVAAEHRIDGGAWQPMTLGASGTSVKALTASIVTGTLQLLSEGVHTIEVRAMDDPGNWSATPGAIDLHLDVTGPDVSLVALDPDALDFTQAVTVTAVHLTTTVADPLSNGVQSTLANAEGFIDTVGAPGTGFDLLPTDGLFDEVAEDAYYDIPTSHLGTLPGGRHTVQVVGLDEAGNWGAAASATITVTVVDDAAPVVSDLSITTIVSGTEILLEGLATDARSNIESAAWYLDSDPATLYPMDATDGSFDTPSEAIQAAISGVDLWGPGPHTIWVEATDFAGNTSDPVSIIYNGQ